VNAYGVTSLVRFQPLSAACGSFLPVLNPVVIPGLRAGICCAVLRGSLYVCIINVTLCDCHAVLKGDYYYLLLVLLLLQCNKQLRILSGKLVTTKKEMSPIGDTICPLSVADNH